VHLTGFFMDRYARRYKRRPLELSEELQRLFQTYEWPGNIRELENMMKRLVVLQDESLILAELGRLRTARANSEIDSPSTAAAPRQPVPAAMPVARPAAAAPPPQPSYATPLAAAPAHADGVVATMGAEGVNLQELARTAAMGAEKEAIQLALERFRWNRRKTAEYLQVSYKTLLNKMKECGISESPSAYLEHPLLSLIVAGTGPAMRRQ